MKKLPFIFLFIVAVLVSASAMNVASGQLSAPLTGGNKEETTEACDLGVLPFSVQNILKQKYVNWHIVTLRDLSGDDQEIWEKGSNGNKCPGIAKGYFENNSNISYAISMYPNDGSVLGIRLIVFSPKHKKIYEEKVLEKYNEATSPQVVYKVPPGDYEDVEKNIRIKLLNDGFQLEAIEKGAFLYYWQSGRYHRLLVSE